MTMPRGAPMAFSYVVVDIERARAAFDALRRCEVRQCDER